MDLNIRPVTPAIMRARGADAFERGLGIDDHDMNPWSSAVSDWQAGWRQRAKEDQQDRAWAARQDLAEVSPP